MIRLAHLAFVMMILVILPPPQTAHAQDYLYQRDVKIPAYQTMREFFDMPNRSGHYLVTLISESIGPLTFRVIRIQGEREHTISKERSYRIGSHEFQQTFENPQGKDDLMVELANSNPAASALVTIYVVELPDNNH